MTQIIDGKAFAAGLREKVAAGVKELKEQHDTTPGLAVVLVGNDPASTIYIRNKKKAMHQVGMTSYDYELPDTATQGELLALLEKLNRDTTIDGILVQLPLPDHMDENAVINAIDPAKDVDGFHAINVGRLATNQPGALISCTPSGCLMLIQDVLGKDLSGKHAVVIGRSNIVGRPMAQLLINHNATVTICHSKTPNTADLCKQADIVIAAVGRPEMVKADWVKDGAVVIDVGINRVDGKLVGDVAFDEVSKKASAITPVPGGVGPMTIACLLRNTFQATCQEQGITMPI